MQIAGRKTSSSCDITLHRRLRLHCVVTHTESSLNSFLIFFFTFSFVTSPLNHHHHHTHTCTKYPVVFVLRRQYLVPPRSGLNFFFQVNYSYAILSTFFSFSFVDSLNILHVQTATWLLRMHTWWGFLFFRGNFFPLSHSNDVQWLWYRNALISLGILMFVSGNLKRIFILLGVRLRWWFCKLRNFLKLNLNDLLEISLNLMK